jgi:Flp pilus assembly protein TadD
MTCVDCHDPHGQSYRDVFLRELPGRFDNGQCTGCHASKAAAPERHSHHQPGSTGNVCVACHMPYLQQPAVGASLQFARSDHSIPIPRPSFDQQLGVENACQKCHGDHDLTWQERQLQRWWGTLKPHPPAVANLLRARQVSDPIEAGALLLTPNTGHPMAETAALAGWLQRFARPGLTNDPRLVSPLMAFARSDDLDLRALGLLALQAGFSQHATVREFLAAPERLPAVSSNAIRLRWSSAADILGIRHAGSGDWPLAIQFLEQAMAANPDNFVAMSHLALVQLQSGDADQAVGWLRKAIQARPNQAVLHFQLGQTLARIGRVPEAIVSLESGLRLAPDDAAARRLLEQLRRP